MNKHIFFDNLTANIGALASGNKKFFAESIDSPTFEELITSNELSVPDISSEGITEVRATSKITGELDSAYRVEKWLGADHPTIIYHHGNNERPFDYSKGAKNSFKGIFVKARDKFDANLIAVRAPFHNGSLQEYQQKMLHLINFMAMITASVNLNESIIKNLRALSSAPVITCGISLGGWVTNLHRCYFNSSTVYVPLLAGAYLGELFLNSKYRKLASHIVFQEPKNIRQLLNFNDDFRKVANANVYPLLATYDRYIEYDIQKKSYEGHPVRTIEKGHVTGSLNTGALRNHILEVLQNSTKSEDSFNSFPGRS
jgi:hypothetical protein